MWAVGAGVIVGVLVSVVAVRSLPRGEHPGAPAEALAPWTTAQASDAEGRDLIVHFTIPGVCTAVRVTTAESDYQVVVGLYLRSRRGVVDSHDRGGRPILIDCSKRVPRGNGGYAYTPEGIAASAHARLTRALGSRTLIDKACPSSALTHRLGCHRPNEHVGVDPLSLPDDPRAPLLTEQEVIVLARELGREPNADPATHPAYAKRMTLQQWNGLTPSPESPTFDGSRVVWLVTVHAPRRTDSGVLQQAYSSLIDAQTGTEISGCIGCSFLRPDGTLNLRPNS